MSEPIDDMRLAHIRSLLRVPDAGGVSEWIAHELLAEVDRLRTLLGAPETVWGHQVHADDGHVGDTVPQGGEFAARKAVEYMNTQILGPDDGARAVLIVHEVWHAETEWRVVEDGR